MDPAPDLSNFSMEQIMQLAMLANSRIQQEQARHRPESSAPFAANFRMFPQMPSSVQGNVMYQGHVQADWNPECGGSAASSQPIRVDSPPRNISAAIDLEATSPPPKVQASSRSGKTDKKKGKEVVNEGEGKRSKKENYQPLEDKLLVHCYLEVSEDPMTNTAQTKECFWDKVTALYNSKRGAYADRTKRSLQTRYDSVRKEVAKFSSYHADVVRRNPSGMTDADKTALACSEFASCEEGNKPFKFMHVWGIMKDNPKFQDTKHGRNYRSTHAAQFEDQLFNPEGDDVLGDGTGGTPTSIASKRPMGRDAAKMASKKQRSASGSTGGSDFAHSMHDLCRTRFADNDNSREAFLQWKKEEKEEARQDRKVMIEIEKQKLAVEQEKVAMTKEIEKERLQLEKERFLTMKVQEEERILAMKLSEIEEPRRTYYAALQKQILARVAPPSDK